MTAQDYLKAIRDEPHKLTQAQVAERTGIPQGTISKIERGQVGDVMSKTYLALQTLYGELQAQVAAAAVAAKWDGQDRRQQVRG